MLPMFLVVPSPLRHGVGFCPALGVGRTVTIGLYRALAPRIGIVR